MSYQTGSASSSTDLLQKLITFLAANGWTQDRSAAEGLGWTVSAHLGSMYAHLRAAENESSIWQAMSSSSACYSVDLYLGTGFTSGHVWNNQTAGAPLGAGSQPIGVAMRTSAGPFSNYYFFCDSGGDNVTVVLERTPGLFTHLGWGSSLQKAGSWTGGAYFFGSSGGFDIASAAGANVPGFTATSACPGVNGSAFNSANGYVRADVDSFTGKWIGIWYGASGADQGFTGKSGDSSVFGGGTMKTNFPIYAEAAAANRFQFVQTSEQDGRSNLLPVYWWALRDGTATGWSLLGSLPNVFWSNAVGSGFSNADEYSIGAQTYKMFPNFAVLKQ